jgi:hypothetical protein
MLTVYIFFTQCVSFPEIIILILIFQFMFYQVYDYVLSLELRTEPEYKDSE